MKVEWLPNDGTYRPCLHIEHSRGGVFIFMGWGEGWPYVLWI